ncbi:MAG: hypothetical protein UX91_C0002G0024 [Candidatus Amesbacteria bacterium GW2011_GWB1_47_19]|nr:MAG: hypothetical protein UW51_C0004G0024 [Candidatus Amesbacteria bacterium GW2011_GWA1_44_24]KKU31699.1 MAG: hypothetical protein UX46_C0003G0024 [Candidatus Amesbacteria bacterium GW2011_GWC1_46_24]KKU67612.1 MAG: hypothetical protein UX91_C0002G0024 [Candidatus Amesbacteria bacterium GW2011_GWB1_47_19]OGD06462.1 MAG: hypothetical protein A2379_02370 [Candidatus Amesbacteria bacterium RIFOXYB1_FULL_47_13]HBC72866.1 hypothetical protein [Candidatus Amesbacteria bacterium]
MTKENKSFERKLMDRFDFEIDGGSTLIIPDDTSFVGLMFARIIANRFMVDFVEKKNGTRLSFNGWKIWHRG